MYVLLAVRVSLLSSPLLPFRAIKQHSAYAIE